MSTKPNPEPDESQSEQVSDGPAAEPGPGGDRGSTSQDQPADDGDGGSEASGADPAQAMERTSEGAADSNERADGRATIVGPDGARIEPPE